MITVIVFCCVLAVAIMVVSGRSKDSGRVKEVQMLCLCEECNAEFVISAGKFRKHSESAGQKGGLGMIDCPECGQDTASIAYKCKHCEAVFLPGILAGTRGRCPECGE